MKTGKSKVIVGSSSEKMIITSGKCNVCGKRVQANFVQCKVFKIDSQVVQWCAW